MKNTDLQPLTKHNLPKIKAHLNKRIGEGEDKQLIKKEG